MKVIIKNCFFMIVFALKASAGVFCGVFSEKCETDEEVKRLVVANQKSEHTDSTTSPIKTEGTVEKKAVEPKEKGIGCGLESSAEGSKDEDKSKGKEVGSKDFYSYEPVSKEGKDGSSTEFTGFKC